MGVSEDGIKRWNKKQITMLIVTEEASGPTLLEFNYYKLAEEEKKRFHFNRAV